MTHSARLAATLAALLLPLPVVAQERATGTVTVEQPPPPASGAVVVGPQGQAVEVPRGAAAQISGANVVVQQAPEGTKLTMQNDVLFAFDKSNLRPEATESLQRVAEIIHDKHPREVRIIGYTDSIGTEEYNQQLSLRRARAVQEWLEANGGGMPPMQVDGRGESDPVAPNTINGHNNPEGRQQNRRVEVLLIG